MSNFDRDEPERGGDLLDTAARNTERHLEVSLQRQRALAGPETHPDFDGKHCVDCGVVIPAARLALEKVRCVACQTEIEEERRRNGR